MKTAKLHRQMGSVIACIDLEFDTMKASLIHSMPGFWKSPFRKTRGGRVGGTLTFDPRDVGSIRKMYVYAKWGRNTS